MPELPEVESVRRSLTRARLRSAVRSIWRSEHALRTGEHWQDEHLSLLRGATPQRWERRGKHLLWRLASKSNEPLGMLVHLGMTGRLEVARTGAPRALHTHVELRLHDDRVLRFVDARRFGGVRARPWEALLAEPPLCDLGPEPLGPGFDGACLYRVAGHSRRALRDVLLDQRVVAGVGNIYALEALFLARLHPLLPAQRLAASAWDRLAVAVRQVLEQGLRNGGTTLRDYRDADGNAGSNQQALWVYGRAGQPCRVCGAALQGFVLGGRGGVLCPVDQRRPRSRRVS
ncbi:bifunctional DNA-formamidopyrimidine glycosylase/DNA-(apurinic or apyrimidinic site) lyase [Paraliomyxa miuraensis]|uniref:bifunctional DNA-formamidopyrimidine glycosylase/DNA-(apurinic or apyrimidinic site) lyase n=1 Tax=Paraliomyxa miuraensis TaxID=376150 RepID=UPI0022512CD9|nr:bifunctional DNA-formamidopyrimidine glycosylase/DNA-(apurinic or apyrimidinic site) lyase [Paraliomyxa miuraensis]MCX4244064.1 bifunctional DNA-formamidopyrimidine glycosylase/DNA-(apurinic or apyrimidinic site) lyase [Paraliomyxa miuraensis]